MSEVTLYLFPDHVALSRLDPRGLLLRVEVRGAHVERFPGSRFRVQFYFLFFIFYFLFFIIFWCFVFSV